jgi:RNA ligase (TIGR02306 family)
MSTLTIEAGYPTKIEDHPNADRMKVATWKGWACCVGLTMTTDTLCVYLQPDALLTHELAETLGVTPYLKKLGKDYPEREKWAGRISVANLRSVKSYGLLTPVRDEWLPHLDNLQEFLDIGKYDPPEKVTAGDSERDTVYFHKYTNIENLRNYPDTFMEGETVIVTEKIHGTNARVGYCPESDGSDWKWMAGSHGVRRREVLPESDKVSLYWQPFQWHPRLKEMIEAIHVKYDCASVIVFGEIFGSGVQDLAYGLKNSEKQFRAFDISVNGEYIDYGELENWCVKFDIPRVPMLYYGRFFWEVVEEMAEGNTIFPTDQIREGVVIRPEKEVATLQGRKIRKMIGFGYLNRKGGTENH